MNESNYILAAYVLTAIALGWLILSSWRHRYRVRKALHRADNHEA